MRLPKIEVGISATLVGFGGPQSQIDVWFAEVYGEA
jgi:hypothetical protein